MVVAATVVMAVSALAAEWIEIGFCLESLAQGRAVSALAAEWIEIVLINKCA